MPTMLSPSSSPWQAVKMTSVKTQLPYEYYSLPFCKPKDGDVHYKTLNLGQPFISPLINARFVNLTCLVG